MTSGTTREDGNVQPGLRMPPRLERASDDGSCSEGQDLVHARTTIRELLEEVRERMACEGRFLYKGWWRTREEIRTLRRQALKDDFARLRDIALVFLLSLGIVAFAYQPLLFFFFP